jgi:hypothetical protein|tara:strand:+ start:724 stop:1257 length:534 start_codon:yes stop_codon:yes gene_type:complete
MSNCLITEARQYVEDVFLTFDIEPNKKLAEIWTNMLMEYPFEVVKSAWGEILGMCFTRRLPKMNEARIALNNSRTAFLKKKYNEDLKDYLAGNNDMTNRSWFSFSKTVKDSYMGIIKGKLTVNQYHKDMSEFFRKAGDKEGTWQHESCAKNPDRAAMYINLNYKKWKDGYELNTNGR